MNVYMNIYVYMMKSRRTRRRDDATTEQGEEQHRHKKKFPAGVLCVAPGFTVNLYQTYKQTSVRLSVCPSVCHALLKVLPNK